MRPFASIFATLLCVLAPSVCGARLVFDDEFDSPDSGAPDSTRWSYCPSGHSAWSRWQSGSPRQAYVSDGCLVLIAEQNGDGYACGGVTTKDKFAFRYGRLEVRARIVNPVRGGWPAIWLMPQQPLYRGWPECGEIDMMEHIDCQSVAHCTVHTWYGDIVHRGALPMTATTPIDPTAFNTYTLDWSPDAVTLSVNGTAVFTYPNLDIDPAQMQWPFATPFYIILNNSLGGRGTWPGPIDTAALPSTFLIDYVRVYTPD